MNLDRLREIIVLVEESGVSEIEIEEDGLRIVVRKDSPRPATAPEPQIVAPVIASPATSDEESTVSDATEDPGQKIHAPIVGTYFSAPSPDSDPFITVGQRVKPGDVLCIIEAMKLMNEIESEVSGVVLEILVENGVPVEFDQPLFVIETT